jgi:phosphoglycolate phosphatase-like HAD superfamily hydrolase
VCESSNIKTEAYRNLFIKDFPEKVYDIEKYHNENAGIIRKIKLKYIWEKILNNSYSKSIEAELIKKYEKMVLSKVLNSALVAGIESYLKYLNSMNRICYIISGTPEEEMKFICEKKNLNKYFKNIYGGEKSKSFWINKIIELEKNNNIVFFGDAMTDYYAAKDTKVDFVFRKTAENKAFLKKFDYKNLVKTIIDFI